MMSQVNGCQVRGAGLRRGKIRIQEKVDDDFGNGARSDRVID
jgi:hypothetical protein